jgi:hypothetical protein
VVAAAAAPQPRWCCGLLILKHVRNSSYDVLEREVRANLVYRDFTRVGGGKMPDAKTMGRWGSMRWFLVLLATASVALLASPADAQRRDPCFQPCFVTCQANSAEKMQVAVTQLPQRIVSRCRRICHSKCRR